MKMNRFTTPLALAIAAAVPALANCGADELCCTDFAVGADLSGVDFGVDADIQGQFTVLAQASSDLAGVASASLADVTAACRAIAIDGGASPEDQNNADAAAPRDQVKAWCNLAVNAVAQVKAAGSLTIDVQPIRCEASVKAAASCNANCSVNAECKGNVSAKPPTCEGGKLEVSCQGECNVSAEAPSIACEGECGGTCEGACTAEGGVAVDCDGKCEGTCTAGGSANGSGVQADGTCQGTCQGTCTMKADAKVKCTASCKGSCNASCKARPGQAAVKCDGSCTGTAEPISCKGGELKANVECQADANCSANCNASVQAKAECTPPSVTVVFQGSATAQIAATIESLKVNLPKLFLVFEARGKSFVDMVGTVSGNATGVLDPGKLGVKGTACLAQIGSVLGEAAGNMSASFEASASVAGSLGK